MLRFYLDSDKVDRTRQSEVPCCQKNTHTDCFLAILPTSIDISQIVT